MALLTVLDFPMETTCSSVSRIEKSGTGDNNFDKWKGTFRSDRPTEMTRPVTVDHLQTGPEYSGRTKPKWSVPSHEPTEISGILG